MTKEDLRPLFSELQGYLSQAPIVKELYNSIHYQSVWDQYNETVNLISKITGEDFSRFLIKDKDFKVRDNEKFIRLILYRQKLGGLISYLHAKYFINEPPPFSSVPSTIISQHQQQNQNLHIQMLLEIQSKIDEKLHNLEEGSKEKNFYKNLKIL